MHRVLIVDDEPAILSALRRVLADEPYSIECAGSGAEALARARASEFDLVLSDFRMPGMDGVTFLEAFKAIRPDAVRLMLSGYADLDALLGAINRAEIYRFIAKPWEDYELKTTLAHALWQRALQLENRRLADQVRVQAQRLNRQQQVLARLEAQCPGITQVERGADGAILLDQESA